MVVADNNVLVSRDNLYKTDPYEITIKLFREIWNFGISRQLLEEITVQQYQTENIYNQHEFEIVFNLTFNGGKCSSGC